MLQELKKMYLKINYNMDIVNLENNDIGLLYFGKRKASPDMIVLIQDDFLMLSDIKKAMKFLHKVGKTLNCNRFHIITKVLPDDSMVKDMAYLNVKVNDYQYIENLKKSIIERKHIELLPHNEFTLKEAENLLKKHRKAAIVQATGTGKSFIIGNFLINKTYGKKVVLTPSKHIVTQIKKYFGEMLDDDISFLTYRKVALMTDDELESLSMNTLILDEFHRVGALKWEGAVKKLIQFNKKAYLIGTTATPRRYLDNDRDMVSELFDGISTEEIDVSLAIARGILPNPKYVYSVFDFEKEIDSALKLVTESKYNDDEKHLKEEWIDSLNNFKIDWNSSSGINDIIKNYIKKDGRNKFIVFCSNKNHLKEMQEKMRACFENNGFILENEEVVHTELYNNEKTLSRFESYKIENANGASLLFCIDMLTEGIHLSAKNGGTHLSGVFLNRSTVSPIIFYQQIGRALATDIEETPMIFDLTNNCASIRTKFYQNDLEQNQKVVNSIRDKFGLDSVNLTSTIDVRYVEMLSLISNIKAKFDISWDKRIAELKKFIDINGHAAISKSNADEGMITWAQGIRSRYFRNELSYNQIEELTQLGFVWDMVEYRWKCNLNELKKFKDEHGFIATITNSMNKDYSVLASNLRSNYRKGSLSKDKIADLEGIGFIWEVDEYKWNLMYDELLKNNELQKDFEKVVPKTTKLKNWITVQKRRYDKGDLSEEKIEKLKNAGVSFLVEKDIWMDGYRKYLFGMNMPKESRPHYIYRWASLQRKLYTEGKLNHKQIELIKNAGVSLKKSDDKFWDYIDELAEYKGKYGTCRVLKKNVENKKFYSWYNNLKSSYDQLSEEKRTALLSIGYERYIKQSSWDNNVKAYKQIKDKSFKSLNNEEKKVYNWGIRVRKLYKSGKLDDIQYRTAKEIGLI